MLNSKSENIKTILDIADKPWSVILTRLKLSNYSDASIEELINTFQQLSAKNNGVVWSDLDSWFEKQEFDLPRLTLKSDTIDSYVTSLERCKSSSESTFVFSLISESVQKSRTSAPHDTLNEQLYKLSQAALKTGLSLTDINHISGMYSQFKPVFLLADHVVNKSKALENWINNTTLGSKTNTSFWSSAVWLLHQNVSTVRPLLMKKFIFDCANNSISFLVNSKALLDVFKFTEDDRENKALESFLGSQELPIEFIPGPVLKWLASDKCNWSKDSLSSLIECSFCYNSISDLVTKKEFDKLENITKLVKTFAQTIDPYTRSGLVHGLGSQPESIRYIQCLYPTVTHKPLLKWLYFFPEKETELLNLESVSDLIGLENADEYDWDQHVNELIVEGDIVAESLPDIDFSSSF